MGFITDLFAPKVSVPDFKRSYKIRESTTKIVGKPLSTIYGKARLKGNVVRRSVSNDKKKIEEDIALCWGPISILNVEINEKDPVQLNLSTWTQGGTLDQPAVGGRDDYYNRTAMLHVNGKATEDFSSISDVSVIGERATLWPTGGSDYDVPAIGYTDLRARNPVYAALDWMLNRDYGASRDVSFFDIDQIIAEGAYCDEVASGSTYPRFSINGEYGKSEDDTFADIAERILGVCNGSFYQSNGKIKVHVPRPKAISAYLTRDTFEPSGATIRDVMETPNIVEVVYKDPESFEDRRVRWENPNSIDQYGEVREEFEFPEITDRVQASRFASYIGRKGIGEAITLRGEADQQHMNLEPGDLVAITVGDADRDWFVDKPFWVHEVTPENRNGDVDLKLVEYAGDTLHNDSRASVLDNDDPILSHDPDLALPVSTETPLPPQGFSHSIAYLERDGSRLPVVDLSWAAAVQPDYMQDSFVIYRRVNLTDPWVVIASVPGGARLFRDTTAEIDKRAYYYAIASRTSAAEESILPGDGAADITVQAARPAAVTAISITPARVQTSTSIDLVLTLTWSDASQTPDSYYRVWYSFNSSGYVYVGETSSLSIELPGLISGSYEFRVTAYDVNGIASTPTVAQITINEDDFVQFSYVENIRLKIGGYEFSGNSPEVVWDAVYPGGPVDYDKPSLRLYRVRVYDTIQNLLREETVQEARYVYSYEKNLEDGLRRDFIVGVTIVGLNGQESGEQQQSFFNVAPALPTGVSLRSSFNNLFLQYTPPADPDWAGLLVYVSTATGFTPDASNLVYDGANTLVTIDGRAENTQYFVKFAPYDAFGKTGLNVSSEWDATTAGLIDVALPPGFQFDSIRFTPNSPSANSVAWTAGNAHVTQNSITTSYAITAGSAAWSSGTLFIYYIDGETQLRTTSDVATSLDTDRIVIATYQGGADLTVGNGDAFIDGSRLIAGSVAAGALVTNTAVITQTIQIANEIVDNSKIKDLSFDKAVGSTLTSGSVFIGGTEFELSGADQALKIYDQQSTPQLRVEQGRLGPNPEDYGLRLYDVDGTLLFSSAGQGTAFDAGASNWSEIIDDGGKPADNADVTIEQQGKLRLSPSDNAIPNPDFELGTDGWGFSGVGSYSVIVSSDPRMGGKVLRCDGAVNGYLDKLVPVDPDKTYYGEFWVRMTADATNGQNRFYAGIRNCDKNGFTEGDGSNPNSYFITSGTPLTVADGWQKFSGTITGVGGGAGAFRATTRYAKPMFLTNFQGGDGVAEIGFVRFTEVNADNIPETASRKWAAQSGADVTGSNTANDVLTGGGKAVAQAGADKTSSNTAANTALISAATDAGNFAFLNQITPANVGTYIQSAAIGSAYIDTVTANQISAGNLGVNGTIYLGNTGSSAYMRLNSDGEINVYDGVRTRIWIGKIGTSYGLILDGPNGERMIDSRSGQGINGTYIQNATVGNAKIANGAITNAKIGNAAITGAKIGNAAITGAKIGNLEVSNAKIANLSVTTAKISNLNVTTGKIADNAVTSVSANSISSSTSDTIDGVMKVDAISTTLSGGIAGSTVTINFSFRLTVFIDDSFSTTRDMWIDIERGNISQKRIYIWENKTTANESYDDVISVTWTDTLPSSGNFTYNIEWNGRQDNTSYNFCDSMSISSRSIEVQEFKK